MGGCQVNMHGAALFPMYRSGFHWYKYFGPIYFCPCGLRGWSLESQPLVIWSVLPTTDVMLQTLPP